jgi:predicted dehydrogenase/threonine dehydrogenase-like Zn-dependent dehydrogenase
MRALASLAQLVRTAPQMKQVLQNVSTGEITVEEVPAPMRAGASLLVAPRFSLISAGTERAVLELGRSSLAAKARARPDLVRQVVDSARNEGFARTYEKVRGRLAAPNPLGYSLAGIVLEAGDDAPAAPGELVACAGAGHASHAEVVSVPRTLCARVPEHVPPEDAAYATVAAIALHGVRLTGLALGDVVAVIGLGLVGQLTVELLRAAGCVALGMDLDPARAELARTAGFFATSEPGELEGESARLTGGRGADGVIVAAASRSAAPLQTATAAARHRATLCVVGDVPIEADRAHLFAKELRLVVSRSYGPGRYDPVYEEGGIDYPAEYVRWTEGRNLAEVLRLMAAGALRPARLTTDVFDLDEAPAAYARLADDERESLGILLRYPGLDRPGPRSVTRGRRRRAVSRGIARQAPRIGVVGAGTFARTVLMPALQRRADIVAVATATGPSARAAADRFNAPLATTDANEVFEADDVDAVVIATRHDTHADYAARALRAGKHVFVEKPLALDEEGLRVVEEAAADSGRVLMVGFNRRFAPLARRLREALGGRGPLVISYRVNAGRVPRSHWTHDPEVGGGRIVGEVCHFVDLASFLCDAVPVRVSAMALGDGSEPREDNLAATLSFTNGSVAVIVYTALGDPAMPKERVEVLGEQGAAALDDYTELRLYRGGHEARVKGKRDKGHDAEMAAFVQACRGGRPPWPVEEMAGAMRATFQVRDAISGGLGPLG